MPLVGPRRRAGADDETLVPCAGAKTHDWKAWNNVMPPGPGKLHVIGKVEVRNPGVEARLSERAPSGNAPGQIDLDLSLHLKPGIWSQQITDADASFEKALGSTGKYTKAGIYCDGKVIETLDVNDVN